MFIEGLIDFGESITRINYGAERTRFPAPVPVGSRLRGGVEIVALEETIRDHHRLVARVTVESRGTTSRPASPKW
ncbi:enoyl-CoA hydratase [Pseudarthrobacter siccitolerans]|uniref:Enoyl-CoA hydratase n=2 Tax=Pseudarthrobacter siccitolerans TaxID=861266 RepID=A0A024H479_9MICC|nr:enoyl-CoA hydratase [Pseudarthrobacter siccitolerans]